ncbi:30S ribosomal protein S21 [Candidatus Nomurabacteria bacterium]|nr:30S ribosomal protein S21 [Candidatus Nomurabacteria bacterium]
MATAVNVEIKRKKNENNGSILKRFTRRVQESGVLSKVRSLRYLERSPSEFTRKKNKLRSIEKRENVQEMIKLGKIPEGRFRRRR